MKKQYLKIADQQYTLVHKVRVKGVDDALGYLAADAICSYMKYIFYKITSFENHKLMKGNRLIEIKDHVLQYELSTKMPVTGLSVVEKLLDDKSMQLTAKEHELIVELMNGLHEYVHNVLE